MDYFLKTMIFICLSLFTTSHVLILIKQVAKAEQEATEDASRRNRPSGQYACEEDWKILPHVESSNENITLADTLITVV